MKTNSSSGFKALFISCVSREFRTHRERLFHYLNSQYHVVTQEYFQQTPSDTLRKLDRLIQQSDAVIHLLGHDPGYFPSVHDLNEITAFLETRELFASVPDAAAALADPTRASYTHWEVMLALHHGKPVLVYEPLDLPASNGTPAAAQAEHRARLIRAGRNQTSCSDFNDMFACLTRDLHDWQVRGFPRSWSHLPPELSVLGRTFRLVLPREDGQAPHSPFYIASAPFSLDDVAERQRPDMRLSQVPDWVNGLALDGSGARIPSHTEWLHASQQGAIEHIAHELCMNDDTLCRLTYSLSSVPEATPLRNGTQYVADACWRVALDRAPRVT